MGLALLSEFGAESGAGIRKLFAEAKKIYEPSGEFMAGTEAGIARGSKRAVASGVQQLASAGLAGTSMVGGLGKKYEEEIGMPARQRATTARLQALAGLLQAEAGAELQMAPRYGYVPTQRRQQTGSSFAPRPTTSTRQPAAAATQQAQPLPRLNLPTLKAAKREPTGYQGIFYGADYYKRQQQQQPKAAPVSGGSLMKQADYYNISGRYS